MPREDRYKLLYRMLLIVVLVLPACVIIFLTLSVLAANTKKPLNSVANPACDLLTRESKTKRESLAAPPSLPNAARMEEMKQQ